MDQWRDSCIGNDNGVCIFLAIASLTVTLYCLYFVSVLFWYYFRQILFYPFTARNTISTTIMRKIILFQVYTNIAYVPHMYKRVKKLWVLVINKDVRNSLTRKMEMRFTSGSGVTSSTLSEYRTQLKPVEYWERGKMIPSIPRSLSLLQPCNKE